MTGADAQQTPSDEGEIRPRVRMYPQHADYSGMEMEFRPYAMYMHPANFRSKAVNTDEIGFRHQYIDNQLMSWDQLKVRYAQADVLVGNSTVFGVDCESDKHTISHFLNEEYPDSRRVPMINLGIRGSTTRQELIVLQSMRGRMPPIRRIVIFSGILNASGVAIPNSYTDADFGMIFSEVYNFNLFCKQYEKKSYDRVDMALYNFHQWVDTQIKRDPRLTGTIERFFGPAESKSTVVADDKEKRFETIMELTKVDLCNWAALARGMGVQIDFVLQPAVNWTRKKLTKAERQLFDLDWANPGYFLAEYATAEFYQKIRGRFEQDCRAVGIAFHDANEWLSDPKYAKETIFIDVCHLTSAGNRIIAKLIREKLERDQPAQVTALAARLKKSLRTRLAKVVRRVLAERTRRRLMSAPLIARWRAGSVSRWFG